MTDEKTPIDDDISRPRRGKGFWHQVMRKVSNLLHLSGQNGEGDAKQETEQLKQALTELITSAQSDAEPIHNSEILLFHNLLELRELTAGDIMIPRADIVAVDVETSFDDFLKIVNTEAHSRMPVYRETLDHVLGMIHIKDVIPYIREGSQHDLRQFLREVLIVSPAMRALDILLEMRSKRTHLALVVDEYGGIDGLVTIEDLIEQIVGQIDDEHDEEETPKLIERADDIILADARATLEEFEEKFGAFLTEDEREEIDTIGGLVVAIAGYVPARGEVIQHESGIEFEIMEADPRRLHRLRIKNYKNTSPNVPSEDASS